MRLFFVGVGGVSMSSLALLALNDGHIVSGYDANKVKLDNVETTDIIDFNDLDKIDTVVYSSAFNLDFPLLKQALTRKKRMFVRGDFLGFISQQYEKVIAVAGAHGKSTVTAMIYNILKVAGKNPTLHIGAFLKACNKNYCFGDKEFFVTEACEFHDNFLFLKPYLGIITNIEPEHLDYFKNFFNVKNSFKKFENNCQLCVKRTSLTYQKLKLDRMNRLTFSVFEGKKKIVSLHLKVLGRFNADDALYAIEVGRKLNIPIWLIKLGLESFEGIQKRFEIVKSIFSARVVLDYAHHPKEIEKVVESSNLFDGKKICVFQPHTYSRTKFFLTEFVDVLNKFDEVFLFKTFPARENPQPEVEEKLLCEISKTKHCVLFYDEMALTEQLKKYGQNDNIFFIGAGNLPEILQQRKIIWR